MRSIAAVVVACAVGLAARADNACLSDACVPGEHHLVLRGVRFWIKVAGCTEGVPVVFLHGGPGQGSEVFARHAGPALEKSLRMVYLDQRGAGRSERPWTREYSIPILVDDVEQLRAALGAPRIAVIGHSFGTILGLEYAAKYPDRVTHLVLAGAAPDIPGAVDVHCNRLKKENPEAYARAMDGIPAGGTCDMFKLKGPDREAIVDRWMFPDPVVASKVELANREAGLRNTGEQGGALFKQGLMTYRFYKADKLTMPVLFISGARDFQAVQEPHKALLAKLPRGKFIEEPGGHFMFVDEPERFAKDVAGFIAPREEGRATSDFPP